MGFWTVFVLILVFGAAGLVGVAIAGLSRPAATQSPVAEIGLPPVGGIWFGWWRPEPAVKVKTA
jgi:hypothetical protein